MFVRNVGIYYKSTRLYNPKEQHLQVLKLRVQWKVGKFFNTYATIGFARTTLFLEVNYKIINFNGIKQFALVV
jgi:hypothetical protein